MKLPPEVSMSGDHAPRSVLRPDQVQQHEELAQSAVDAMCESRQQTYEELVQDFLFFDPQSPRTSANASRVSPPTTSKTTPRNLQSEAKLVTDKLLSPKPTNSVCDASEDLDVEVLKEASSSVCASGAGKLPQIDNFLQSDLCDPLDDSPSEDTYTASCWQTAGVQTASSKKTGNKFHIKPDTNEENILQLIGDEELSTDEEENEEDEDDLIVEEVVNKDQLGIQMIKDIPGEVEQIRDDVAEIKHHSILDFTARSGISQLQSQEEVTDCVDEVTPFSLDENFDYNNPILTPKYTEYPKARPTESEFSS